MTTVVEQPADVPQEPVAGSRPAQGSILDLLMPLAQNWGRLLVVPLLAGGLAFAGSFLVTPMFASTTTFLPPQQQQTAVSSAVASLGMLAGLAGAGTRSPADQMVSLMQSTTTVDRLIDHFKLMQVYDVDKRWKARRDLAQNTAMSVGKKDGLITVTVEDEDPRRAADIANRYVEELRRLTSILAVTEAQERRVFFEQQLGKVKQRLTQAQVELEASGFSLSALKAEPKAAAEGYAKLRADLTAAEVRLQALRGAFTDTTPEVRQLQNTVTALRAEVAKIEASSRNEPTSDYIGKYREFKYQEVLFELMARQYELARVDESREGALIQVLDTAIPAERKSSPKRSVYLLLGTLGTFMAYAVFLSLRFNIRQSAATDPEAYARWTRFKNALRLQG